MKLPFAVDGDGTGPKLVFAHGLMGTGAAQRLQIAPFIDAGWTVATFDQRGHGPAPAVTDAEGYDPNAMGADLWEVADAAGFDRCWIGGGSMGAATSFCAAQQQPKRVEGFIQVVPALRDTPHPLIFVFDAAADAVRDGGVDGLITLLEEFASGQGREQDATFVEQLRSHDPASLECALRSVPRWILPDVPSAFATLEFPVVVIGWQNDPIHPFETAVDIAAAAGVELIEGDQVAALADRDLMGKMLLEHINAVRT